MPSVIMVKILEVTLFNTEYEKKILNSTIDP